MNPDDTRLLDTLDRIADSLELIAGSLVALDRHDPNRWVRTR